MKPVELKYYPFVISIDNRTGNCNVLSPKTCVPKEISLKVIMSARKIIV